MSTQTSTIINKNSNLNFILGEIFRVLSEREQKVVTHRFSLTGKRRETLAKIGARFSVTRERIRQIESSALQKLRRTISSTKLQDINLVAKNLLHQAGKVQTEEALISLTLGYFKSNSELDRNIIRLALAVDDEIIEERTSNFKLFWHFESISFADIKLIAKEAVRVLNKQKIVLDELRLANLIRASLANAGKKFSIELIKSVFLVDPRLKKVADSWGLMEWRNINPRSLRDKALIIFREAQRPLHFEETVNLISEKNFDKKIVTVQTVHNELIRDPRFILIGRGLYALEEWGYTEGTVADIIEEILEKKGPLNREEIIRQVLKQRKVKKSTILLNLQQTPWFVPTGVALYKFEKKLKNGPEAFRKRRGGKKFRDH